MGTKGTFGLGGSIALEGFEGRREKGSVNWSGMPGLHAVSLFSFLLDSVDKGEC